MQALEQGTLELTSYQTKGTWLTISPEKKHSILKGDFCRLKKTAASFRKTLKLSRIRRLYQGYLSNRGCGAEKAMTCGVPKPLQGVPGLHL